MDASGVMHLFDDLPPEVRRVIAAAGFPFHPRTAWRLLRRGMMADRVAVIIAAADRRLARIGGAA